MNVMLLRGGEDMKKKLVKPISKQDERILSLYNAENEGTACSPNGNSQCKC